MPTIEEWVEKTGEKPEEEKRPVWTDSRDKDAAARLVAFETEKQRKSMASRTEEEVLESLEKELGNDWKKWEDLAIDSIQRYWAGAAEVLKAAKSANKPLDYNRIFTEGLLKYLTDESKSLSGLGGAVEYMMNLARDINVSVDFKSLEKPLQKRLVRGYLGIAAGEGSPSYYGLDRLSSLGNELERGGLPVKLDYSFIGELVVSYAQERNGGALAVLVKDAIKHKVPVDFPKIAQELSVAARGDAKTHAEVSDRSWEASKDIMDQVLEAAINGGANIPSEAISEVEEALPYNAYSNSPRRSYEKGVAEAVARYKKQMGIRS